MKRLTSLLFAALLVAGGIATFLAPSAGASQAPAASAGSARPVFNVMDFGAAGNGTSNDTPAINAAITAANAAGPDGGIVEVPAGTYLAGGSIHMMSNVTLHLDAGSTITAAATGFDPPEPNPYSQYQDFGHSHFHDAVIWGEDLTNVGFTGSGTITGAGHLISGTPNPGQADKLISLVNVDGLVVSGITLVDGGHFGMLIDHCTRVVSNDLTISTAADRDGWNVIDTTDVRITNINISSNDDALVFKSDWALGQTFSSGNVVVNNAHLSSKCCNGLMFGSETCGNFTNYHFSNIYVTLAGKSGLGMVSEDGANISDVTYDHVVMSDTQSPIMEKIGTRLRCGGSPTVGSISGIHYNNVTGTDAGAFSPTLWGQPGHPVRDITFSNVHLTLPGGTGPMDPNAVPTDNGDYNPNSISTRPAYGFYLHNVAGITFNNTSLRLASDDQRPALIANAGSDITLHNVTVQAGSGSPFDAGFQDVTGYCLAAAKTTTGGAPRISTPGSTPAGGHGCNAGLDNFALSASPASATVTAGASATVTVNTAVTAGDPGPVTLAASGEPPGVSVSFSPATVTAGRSSQMTVSAAPDILNGNSQIEITGTDTTATQYATVPVTVTGGVALQISNLSVADTANAASWSVQSNLQPGDVLYGDRTFKVASLPAALHGADWIRTANSSKLATENPMVTFDVNAPVTVAIGVDTRLGGRLPWMDSSWTDTGTQLADNESTPTTFEVYAKTFPAGQVSLGPQGITNDSDMYTVAVF